MLHLDIKPANLLLSGVSGNKSGAAGDKAITVKVADMGLSLLLEKGETSTAHR
jgi:serine/threonine protein kinase